MRQSASFCRWNQTNNGGGLDGSGLAVMVVFPAAPAGMVIRAVKEPVAVVRNWNVAEPTITVSVVEAPNPAAEKATINVLSIRNKTPIPS